MMVILFLILLSAALGTIFFGVKYQHWIMCAVSFCLFLILATQAMSIEIPTKGIMFVFEDPIMVIGAWVGVAISLIFTIYGLFSYVKESRQPKGLGVL